MLYLIYLIYWYHLVCSQTPQSWHCLPQHLQNTAHSLLSRPISLLSSLLRAIPVAHSHIVIGRTKKGLYLRWLTNLKLSEMCLKHCERVTQICVF